MPRVSPSLSGSTKLLSTYNSTEFGVPQPGTTAPKYSWQGRSGLPIEFGASGSTGNGGASYVPLIGRPLQTASVAAPGAFPNGNITQGVVQANYLQAAAASMHQLAVEREAALQEVHGCKPKKKRREPDVYPRHAGGFRKNA
ncbi:MAG: hypothetical protein ACYDCQ_18460 [Dehalococcoidia bacterium]